MKCLIIALASFATAIMPLAGIRAATISPGDLIKASGPAVYYYHTDGTRLVFPNEKTYFTWYDDFSNVKTISDAELASIMLGGNVTYRPGVKLVKVTTDPKVYAVGADRMLRWVQSEMIAADLYGANWAKQVHDIPDAFFVDYETGDPIGAAANYDKNAVRDAARTIADTRSVVTHPTETIETNVNDTFTITLDSNATTGYAWEAIYDETYLELVSSSYIEPDMEMQLVGMSGQEEFVFKALQEGTAEITMNYRRSWETGVDPIEVRTYRVEIAPGEAPPIAVITLMPNKTEAQPNETVSLFAETTYTGSINRMQFYTNGTMFKECAGSASCTAEYTIPLTASESTFTFTVKLLTYDDGTFEASKTISIVRSQHLSSIKVLIDRPVMKQSQVAKIAVRPGSEINAKEITIYIDGVSERNCTLNPLECVFEDYIPGDIGSVHEVYAKIRTPSELFYISDTKTITISDNDAPQITVTPSKDAILPTETVMVTAAANDDDGVASVEIFRDGTLIKRCESAAPCSAEAGPFDLPSGSVISFDAKATDLIGTEAMTDGAASVTIL